MSAIADLEKPTYTHPDLTRKFVVIHNGVGIHHKRGDVAAGQDFFLQSEQLHTTTRRTLNKETGLFEHHVIEERYGTEAECLAGIQRLLQLGAVRPATASEAACQTVDLEPPVSTAEVTGKEQLIERQQKEIDRLKAELAGRQTAVQPATVAADTEAAPVITQQRVSVEQAGIMLTTTTENTASGVPIQPPPGAKSAPRKTAKE